MHGNVGRRAAANQTDRQRRGVPRGTEKARGTEENAVPCSSGCFLFLMYPSPFSGSTAMPGSGPFVETRGRRPAAGAGALPAVPVAKAFRQGYTRIWMASMRRLWPVVPAFAPSHTSLIHPRFFTWTR